MKRQLGSAAQNLVDAGIAGDTRKLDDDAFLAHALDAGLRKAKFVDAFAHNFERLFDGQGRQRCDADIGVGDAKLGRRNRALIDVAL